MILETIETVENWNFKLSIDQKKVLQRVSEYFDTNNKI